MRRVIMAIALLAAAPAAAQDGGWFSQGAFDSAIFNAQADTILRRSHQTIFNESVEESLRRPAAPAPRSPRPPIAAALVQQVAGELAAAFPADQRGKATALFVELYRRYSQLERQLGVTAGDPAGGLAMLTAASYMAFADAELSDAAFRALYAQMRGIAAGAKSAPAEAHDRVTIAMLATYLGAAREALKEKPDAARSGMLKAAAGSYLRALLGIDPARVRISEKGLGIG